MIFKGKHLAAAVMLLAGSKRLWRIHNNGMLFRIRLTVLCKFRHGIGIGNRMHLLQRLTVFKIIVIGQSAVRTNQIGVTFIFCRGCKRLAGSVQLFFNINAKTLGEIGLQRFGSLQRFVILRGIASQICCQCAQLRTGNTLQRGFILRSVLVERFRTTEDNIQQIAVVIAVFYKDRLQSGIAFIVGSLQRPRLFNICRQHIGADIAEGKPVTDLQRKRVFCHERLDLLDEINRLRIGDANIVECSESAAPFRLRDQDRIAPHFRFRERDLRLCTIRIDHSDRINIILISDGHRYARRRQI